MRHDRLGVAVGDAAEQLQVLDREDLLELAEARAPLAGEADLEIGDRQIDLAELIEKLKVEAGVL